MAFFLSIKRSRNKGNLSVRCKHPVCISGNISSSGISSKVGSPASSIQINSYLRKCLSGNVCSIWPSYRNIRRFPMRKLNNFSILIFQGNFRTISHRFESSFSYWGGEGFEWKAPKVCLCSLGQRRRWDVWRLSQGGLTNCSLITPTQTKGVKLLENTTGDIIALDFVGWKLSSLLHVRTITL